LAAYELLAEEQGYQYYKDHRLQGHYGYQLHSVTETICSQISSRTSLRWSQSP